MNLSWLVKTDRDPGNSGRSSDAPRLACACCWFTVLVNELANNLHVKGDDNEWLVGDSSARKDCATMANRRIFVGAFIQANNNDDDDQDSR